MKDHIFCKGCQQNINIHEDTIVQKNKNWDLYCSECFTWLGGMKKLLNWEIDEPKGNREDWN